MQEQTTSIKVDTQEQETLKMLNSLKTLEDVQKITKSKNNTMHIRSAPFSAAAGKRTVWLIDRSSLAPNPLTLMSTKGFEVAYRAQLESTLYHNSETPNLAAVSEISYLYERMCIFGTIQLKSSSYVRKIQVLTKVLNAFFRDNEKDIAAISSMVNNTGSDDVTEVQV